VVADSVKAFHVQWNTEFYAPNTRVKFLTRTIRMSM